MNCSAKGLLAFVIINTAHTIWPPSYAWHKPERDADPWLTEYSHGLMQASTRKCLYDNRPRTVFHQATRGDENVLYGIYTRH